MASLAEVKADTIYFLAKGAEIFIPPIQLDPKGPPDTKNQFVQNARISFANFTKSEKPTDKAEALVELSQQLINVGRFRQARQYLGMLKELNPLFSLDNQCYYTARRREKFAWIADYETGFKDELKYLSASRKSIEKISPVSVGQRERDLLSTITHFSGRARLGLAGQGIDPQYNLDRARSYFNSDLLYFQKLRGIGDPRPANEGFQHGWLALCDITAGNLERAHAEIEEAGQLFREFSQQPENSKSGIEAHYYLLRGLLLLKTKSYELAQEMFRTSIDIRIEKKEPYPMGEASARMGIARAALGQRDLPTFASSIREAVQAHRLILLSAVNGRPTS